jgi:hypothetical protein
MQNGVLVYDVHEPSEAHITEALQPLRGMLMWRVTADLLQAPERFGAGMTCRRQLQKWWSNQFDGSTC